MFDLLLILTLRPVSIVQEEESEVLLAKLENLHEGPGHNLLIKRANDSKRYDINRVLEQKLELEELRSALFGKKVSLKYPASWSPLDPVNETIHISILEFEGKKLYDETHQE